MKRSDIPDEHVVSLARAWQAAPFATPGVMQALIAEGVPRNLAYAKVMHLVDRRLLDYGTSPDFCWPT